MSDASKALLKTVNLDGLKISTVEALDMLPGLPDGAFLTTSESAVLMRESVTTLERWRMAGTRPKYSQGGSLGAKGTNQKVTYEEADLIAYKRGQKVGGTIPAAIRKGQLFATLADVVEPSAFYADQKSQIESMVKENLARTVLERIGVWEMFG